jgi:CRISPR-associated endonuclease/helicase Cas3
MANNEKCQLIAHVKRQNENEWAKPHSLLEHLEETSRLAQKFAESFASGEFAKILGLIHDFGKATTLWQDYIRCKSGYDEFNPDAHLEGITKGKVEHSILGAKFAEVKFGKALGRFFAYCIAGHHGGIPDYFSEDNQSGRALELRMQKAKTDGIGKEVLELLNYKPVLVPPFKFCEDKPLLASLWIRMLFSCLVDADFLDTEKYMEPEKHQERANFSSINELEKRFDSFMADFDKKVEKSKVNKIRAKILSDCLTASQLDRGIFSLTVPTGGGKTLSSLGFALKHAKKNNLERVIYVIPYTSIIEQNADVFKRVLGADNVIEHHSNLDSEDVSARMRLASENWDAPVIVTTSVQFYESLFSAKTSRCRKLHNIVRSVIVLDEAQLLPVEFLSPMLQTLQLLVDHFSVSLVISTATQPALESRNMGSINFKGLVKGSVKEIINDVSALYRDLKRVKVELPENLDQATTLTEIAKKCSEFEQVLCIVSDRKTCRDLYNFMPAGTIHLSALMCGQHRSEKIDEIKCSLRNGDPIRVVSTQLVEAGVDLDFPVVFRALAGLDSIAQAAGRCNREGKLETGIVKVFVPEKKSPPGILRKAAETTTTMLKRIISDPLEPESFNTFFNELYWKANSLDAKDIVAKLTPDYKEFGIKFRSVSDDFKLINDEMQRQIIVRYGESEELLDMIKKDRFNEKLNRALLRKLQRYSVNVYLNDFEALRQRRSIEEIMPGIFALTTSIEYSTETGLKVDDCSPAPEDLVL